MPPAEYLERVCGASRRAGVVAIFDEITSGFRLAVGGAHLRVGVAPDVAVFAKGMSNGYPMAAIIGRRAVMAAAERTFLSSTYWTERIGPAAALATVRKIGDRGVPAHLAEIGERMRAGWQASADRHGLRIVTRGVAPLPSFTFDHGDAAAVLRTLYTQCMLDEGFLAAGAFYPSLAHQAAHVDAALGATDRAFAVLTSALADGSLRARLRGPVAAAGLRGPRS
jgi:glutamate-1-semialdehyde aminotransferase